MDEVRAYLKKHPKLASAFHRAPHKAGSTTADLVYEVGARKQRLAYMKHSLVNAITGKSNKSHDEAHKALLEIAKKAAAKTMKKKSVVTVAPEPDPDDQSRPPVP